MGAIEREDLSDTPPEVIKAHFGEQEGHWHNIQSILKDMLPEFDNQ